MLLLPASKHKRVPQCAARGLLFFPSPRAAIHYTRLQQDDDARIKKSTADAVLQSGHRRQRQPLSQTKLSQRHTKSATPDTGRIALNLRHTLRVAVGAPRKVQRMHARIMRRVGDPIGQLRLRFARGGSGGHQHEASIRIGGCSHRSGACLQDLDQRAGKRLATGTQYAPGQDQLLPGSSAAKHGGLVLYCFIQATTLRSEHTGRHGRDYDAGGH